MRRDRVLAAVLVVWALVGVSCGQAADEAATGTPEPTRSPTPTPVTTPASTANNGCDPSDEEDAPEGSACVGAADVDLDGDGRVDRAVVYAPRADDPTEVVRTLSVEVASGDVLEVELPPAEFARREPDLDGADANGVPGEELFVTVGWGGASTEELGIFTLDGDGLARVRAVEGEAFSFLVFGSVSHGDGAACRDTDDDGALEFVLLSASKLDAMATEWEWEDRVYEWRGASVELADTRRGTVEGGEEGAPPPRLDGYWALDCGDVDIRG